MDILGIDPGTTNTAYTIINEKREILFKGYESNSNMRARIGLLCPEYTAIEMVACYGMAVGREVFETCVWIGRFIEQSKLPKYKVYRKDIKLELCGQSRAKDANVRQALIDIYGKQGTTKNPGGTFGISGDIWASLAVCEYFLRQIERNPLGSIPVELFPR